MSRHLSEPSFSGIPAPADREQEFDAELIRVAEKLRCISGLKRHAARLPVLTDSERLARRSSQKAFWSAGLTHVVDEGLLLDALHRHAR